MRRRAVELGVALFARAQGFDQAAGDEVCHAVVDGQPDSLLIVDIDAEESLSFDERASRPRVDADLLEL
jgi:hypothetical protein